MTDQPDTLRSERFCVRPRGHDGGHSYVEMYIDACGAERARAILAAELPSDGPLPYPTNFHRFCEFARRNEPYTLTRDDAIEMVTWIDDRIGRLQQALRVAEADDFIGTCEVCKHPIERVIFGEAAEAVGVHRGCLTKRADTEKAEVQGEPFAKMRAAFIEHKRERHLRSGITGCESCFRAGYEAVSRPTESATDPATPLLCDICERFKNKGGYVSREYKGPGVCTNCGLSLTYAIGRASSEPATPAIGRCPICDWPMSKDDADGCHPDNCSYRPREGSEEWTRIQERRRKLGADKLPADHPAADTPTPEFCAHVSGCCGYDTPCGMSRDALCHQGKASLHNHAFTPAEPAVDLPTCRCGFHCNPLWPEPGSRDGDGGQCALLDGHAGAHLFALADLQRGTK